MGIQGLTSFVMNTPTLGQSLVRRVESTAAKATSKTKIVVDGYAFLFHIYLFYKIDWVSGGQYDQLKYELESYFSSLQRAGFSPYVLFDGVSLSAKQQEQVDRAQSTVQSVARLFNAIDAAPNRLSYNGFVLPALAPLLMRQVLKKLNVPYTVCDDEADVVMGSHANNNGCCVMSKDSDFFVFNLQQGYIPLDFIRIFKDKITYKVYKTADLCKTLNIHADLLPAFASLCGNDFVPRAMLRPFHIALRDLYPASMFGETHDKSLDVARVGKFLSQFKTVSEAFDAALELYEKQWQKYQEEKEKAIEAKPAEAKPATPAAPVTAVAVTQTTTNDVTTTATSVTTTTITTTVITPIDAPKAQTDDDNKKTTDATQDSGDADERQQQREDQQRRDDERQNKLLAMDPQQRREHIRGLLNTSAQQYVTGSALISADETSLRLHANLAPIFNQPTIPVPILQQYRAGWFDSNLMSVLTQLSVWCHPLVEDSAVHDSAYDSTRAIRKLMYGILVGGAAAEPKNIVVSEYVRSGDKFAATPVTPSYTLNGKKLPGILTIGPMNPKARGSLLLEALSANTPAILALPADWILPAALARCWLSLHPTSDYNLNALILTLVTRPHYTVLNSVRQESVGLPRSRAKSTFLASWHTTIYTGELFNNALINPFAIPSPAQLYDGESILYYVQKLEGSGLDTKKRFLKTPEENDLFAKLYEAITQDLDRNISKSVEQKKKDEGALAKERLERERAAEVATKANRYDAFVEEGATSRQVKEPEEEDDGFEQIAAKPAKKAAAKAPAKGEKKAAADVKPAPAKSAAVPVAAQASPDVPVLTKKQKKEEAAKAAEEKARLKAEESERQKKQEADQFDAMLKSFTDKDRGKVAKSK